MKDSGAVKKQKKAKRTALDTRYRNLWTSYLTWNHSGRGPGHWLGKRCYEDYDNRPAQGDLSLYSGSFYCITTNKSVCFVGTCYYCVFFIKICTQKIE